MAVETSHRVLAIVTDAVEGRESIEELCRGDGEGIEIRLVLPAVEETPFRHLLGDVDEPVRDAEERLRASLEALRRSGIPASGAVGDSDPVLAAQDALREGPVDEVVIFEHAPDQSRWFEDGLFERAQKELPAPLRMVLVRAGESDGPHIVAVEDGDPARAPAEAPPSQNLPRFSRGDLAGIVTGIAGTIAAALLAGAGPGPESGWGAASILIAMGIALVNLAHVVGLTLFESVRYRGGFETFVRTLSLVGTPLAVTVNLLILLLA